MSERSELWAVPRWREKRRAPMRSIGVRRRWRFWLLLPRTKVTRTKVRKLLQWSFALRFLAGGGLHEQKLNSRAFTRRFAASESLFFACAKKK